MHPLAVLRDSLALFVANLVPIARLCLPLVVIQAALVYWLDQQFGTDRLPTYDMLLSLVFYPLLTTAVMLYLDAHSHGSEPKGGEIWSRALRAWPTFVALLLLSAVMMLGGFLLLVVPGIWLMMKLALAQPLLVLQGRGVVEAVKESFVLTRGYLWKILVCEFALIVPLWLLAVVVHEAYPAPRQPLPGILVASALIFMQLITAVLTYRLFTAIEQAKAQPPAT